MQGNYNYRTLIEKLDKADLDFEPSAEEFAPIIHDLYLDKNTDGMMRLLDSLTKFYFNESMDEDSYSPIYECAAEQLLGYAEEAEFLYQNPCVDFYKKSFSYWNVDIQQRKLINCLVIDIPQDFFKDSFDDFSFLSLPQKSYFNPNSFHSRLN